ncbi:MAG TPA: ACT domain-containing protein [Gemmataceae bacterium]|nr:ACT domain-containing protein [Gemmataceae bacterium]
MEKTKQVSVFLENKPGRLAHVLSALAREKVNLTALTVMDSHEHNVLRLVPSDPIRTVQVLKSLGIPYAETEVLLVELRNQPGALAHVCEVLGAEHVNIDYAYCSAGGRNGRTMGVFKVSNTEKAMRVLSEPANNVARRRPQPRPPRDRRSYQLRGSV